MASAAISHAILACRSKQVRVVYLDGSGSYGGNGSDDVAADAVLISRAVGRPVRVQWMREDELGLGPERSAAASRFARRTSMRRATSPLGRTEAWLPENTPRLASRPLEGFIAAGIPQPQGQTVAQIQGNAYPSYDLPNMTAMVHWLKTNAAQAIELARAGKARQFLRHRMLHRRIGGGRRARSPRIPSRASERPVRRLAAQARRRAHGLEEPARAQSRQHRRPHDEGTRACLCLVQAHGQTAWRLALTLPSIAPPARFGSIALSPRSRWD